MSGSTVNLMVPLDASYTSIRQDSRTTGSMLSVNHSGYPFCRTRYGPGDALASDPLLPLNPYYWPTYSFSSSWFGSLNQTTPSVALNRPETKERSPEKEPPRRNEDSKEDIVVEPQGRPSVQVEERSPVKCRVISKPRSSSDSSVPCGVTQLPMNGPEGMTAATDPCSEQHTGWLAEGSQRPPTSPIQMTGPDLTRIVNTGSSNLFRPPLAVPGGSDRIFPSSTTSSSSTSGGIPIYQPHITTYPNYYPLSQGTHFSSPPRQYYAPAKSFSHTQVQGRLNEQSKSGFKVRRNAEETMSSPRQCKVPDAKEMPHSSYRVPTGKEGSLKHRILRPHSINIIEPPSSVIGEAPLSAPPIREPTPKHPRLSTPAPKCSSKDSPPSISTTNLQYPVYFMKGSIIQLANGQLKHVEDLTTEDFLQSASISPDLRIDSSTVVKMERSPLNDTVTLGFSVGQKQVQVTVEAPIEHPFFVFNQGWSSCSPERTTQRYGLACHRLKPGNLCISLTHKDMSSSSQQTEQTQVHTKVVGEHKTEIPPSTSQRFQIATNSSTTQTNNQRPKRKRRWSAPGELPIHEQCTSS